MESGVVVWSPARITFAFKRTLLGCGNAPFVCTSVVWLYAHLYTWRLGGGFGGPARPDESRWSAPPATFGYLGGHRSTDPVLPVLNIISLVYPQFSVARHHTDRQSPPLLPLLSPSTTAPVPRILRAAMRVKIHTVAPLTERKVLLPVDGHLTIAQLTERVCDSVLTDDRPISPEQLALEVDGFELLADSTTAVLEKSDIVTYVLTEGQAINEPY